jgi:hypothetical protein
MAADAPATSGSKAKAMTQAEEIEHMKGVIAGLAQTIQNLQMFKGVKANKAEEFEGK